MALPGKRARTVHHPVTLLPADIERVVIVGNPFHGDMAGLYLNMSRAFADAVKQIFLDKLERRNGRSNRAAVQVRLSPRWSQDPAGKIAEAEGVDKDVILLTTEVD